MKLKFLFAMMIVFTVLTADAQFGKIPVEATNAFSAKYPTAKNVQWRSRVTSYKTEFDVNKQHYTAEFDSKGQWVRTEARLAYDKLPKEVSDGFHKSLYTTWEFNELMQVEEVYFCN